jgi:hypothetical protein
MVVQPAILTYPTMVFYFWIAPRVIWNALRGIVIKQRLWQTFWVRRLHMFSPLPVPMAAGITKYLNKYVRRGICLIYMSSFYFWSPPLARKTWRPEVDENWAIMVVQLAILTYPTMVFYFWLGPQVLWNDLRGIVIKQMHWKPMSGGRLK